MLSGLYPLQGRPPSRLSILHVWLTSGIQNTICTTSLPSKDQRAPHQEWTHSEEFGSPPKSSPPPSPEELLCTALHVPAQVSTASPNKVRERRWCLPHCSPVPVSQQLLWLLLDGDKPLDTGLSIEAVEFDHSASDDRRCFPALVQHGKHKWEAAHSFWACVEGGRRNKQASTYQGSILPVLLWIYVHAWTISSLFSFWKWHFHIETCKMCMLHVLAEQGVTHQCHPKSSCSKLGFLDFGGILWNLKKTDLVPHMLWNHCVLSMLVLLRPSTLVAYQARYFPHFANDKSSETHCSEIRWKQKTSGKTIPFISLLNVHYTV